MLIAAAVVAADQLVKAAVRACLEPGRAVTLVPGVVDLKLAYNLGAAFSVGEGMAWLFTLIAAVICLAAAVYVVLGRPGTGLSCSLAVLTGGALGNLIDRVAFGCVTDFICPTFVNFAIFNVADIAITVGYVFAFVLFCRGERSRA